MILKYAYRLKSASVKKAQCEFAVRNRNNEMQPAAAFGGAPHQS